MLARYPENNTHMAKQLNFANRPLTSFDLNTFGGRLGYAIRFAKVTLQRVADEVGVNRASISGLCMLDKPRTSSRKVPELAAFLGVPADWLAYGTGEAPTGPVTFEESESGTLALRGPQSQRAGVHNPALTGLQAATLEKLEALMVAGAFGDMDCVEFLTTLKPKLSAIEAADKAVVS